MVKPGSVAALTSVALVAGARRRLRRLGAQEVTWAYVLSGAVALALLVYLVVALFRAEDL